MGGKCFSRKVLPNLTSEVRLVRKALPNEADSMEQRQGQKEGSLHTTILKNRGLQEQGEAAFCNTE